MAAGKRLSLSLWTRHNDVLAPENELPSVLDEYDLFGFGSGVYFGRLHAALRSWVDRLRPQVGKRPAFIFSTAGSPSLYKVSHWGFKRKLSKAGFDVVGEFSCPGYDTFGPLRLIGGLNRGRPSLFEYDFEYDVVHDPHDSLIRLVTAGVRPMLAIAPDSRPIRRVLIAYSGSMESAKTIKWFVQLGLWPRAQLRIVTFEHQVDEAEQLVADAADYCRAHGLEPEEAYVPDSPKDHLLPYAAEWGADMIVAGNSAKNLLLRRVFGETALNLITNADRPLFLAQ